MEKRTRDSGTPARPTGRQPGWFARRPAMTILSTPLRLSVSRSLRPMANRLSTWSHSLASRWLPLRPAAKAWRGILDFSVSPRRAGGERRDFRRTAGVSSGKLFTQHRLQTLSLPEGYRFEDPTQENEPENRISDAFSMDASQAVEPLAAPGVTRGEDLPQSDAQTPAFSSENSPDEGITPANFQAVPVNPVTPGEETPQADFEAPDNAGSAPHPPGREARQARPGLTGSARAATTKISPPRWPFRLVSPFSEQKQPAARYSAPGGREFRKPHFPLVHEAGTALGSRPSSSAVVLARSQAIPAAGESARPRLVARPILDQNLPLLTTSSSMVILPLQGAVAPLILFGRSNQPVAGQANPGAPESPSAGTAGQPVHQLGTQSSGVRIVQKKTSAVTRSIQIEPAITRTQRATSEPSGLVQSPSGETLASTPNAQVRPPEAMLTLYPPHQPETEATLLRPESQSYESRLEQEWPLLSVLHRLETRPEEPLESSAVQVLRRMWPAQSALVRQTLQALAASGAGEQLPSTVLGPLQTQLGRNLSEVRLHTSPLVQTLRAEAFTSGSHVVFAPGRLDISTGKGLALLGHELTHIGQPLAFKQESSASQVFEDSHERAARQQEESIQNIVEHGWPKTHSMELRHAAPAATAISATSAYIQRQADEDSTSAQAMDSSGSSSASAAAGESSGQAAGAAQPGSSGAAGSSPSSGGAPGGGAAGPGAPNANVDALARQVYGILKNRLRSERDRRELYNF
jgi:hypothetical protein